MTISIKELFRYSLAIFILISFIAMIVYFFIGLKDKNYVRAKIFAMIYVCLNEFRLILNYLDMY